MSISKEAYRELAAVVGDEFISDKDYVLAGNRGKTPEIPFEYHSAEAIVLPGSTEEVSQIVKICNKYGLNYIAIVSGAFVDGYANREGTIIIQLKRMNRIVEINEQDRYVVVEPGVRHVQRYPELRKRGWSYAAASVGPGGSVLANYTNTSGDHHTQHGLSRCNRYLLGVEFVSPEGEIIRTGSLQTDSGWFCPDGPGPGLRGMIKGYYGSHGQMGVMTRAAVAINTCVGPKEIVTEGISPHHTVRMDGDFSQVYVFNYPDIRSAGEAMLKLGEAEIASTVQKYFYLPIALLMTDSANQFWETWTEDFKREMAVPVVVHLTPRSAEELAYEEQILMDVVAETGGRRIPREIEQWWDDHKDYFMLVSTLQRVLRLGGSWMPIKLGADSVTHICEVGASVGEYIHEYTDTGKIFDAPENYQILPMEYGHFAHIEMMFMWDRYNPESMRGAGEFRARSRAEDIARHYHAETPGCLNRTALELGPLFGNYDVWLQRIKASLDPNNVANPMI